MKIFLAFFAILLIASGCKKNNSHGGKNQANVIYLENNDFHDNENAVLAYRNNEDGSLSPLAGSPFLTGGSGIANPAQALGPDDSDDQLRISSNGAFLMAVNPGSNTIAVFRIQADGGLTPVSGSPFPSGGQTPVSIDTRGDYIYVVNKNSDPLHPSTSNPNYVTFKMEASGALTLLQDSKLETSPGVSPSQALVSANGRFLFGADFLGFMLTPAPGTLRSIRISDHGKLTNIAGSPYTIPGAGGALGLWQHPASDILYVGFPLQGKIGIYGIDESSGALRFQSTLDAGLAACWLRTTKNGHYLYALNSGENTISVYNAANAISPSALGKITLKQSGPSYMAMGLTFTSSEDFGLAFSPDEKLLYVISQSTNPDFSLGNFNYLHVLMLANDGTLTEPAEPLQLPVDATLRPQGLAVVNGEFENMTK